MKKATALWEMAQAELRRSNTDPKHPYKTVVLSTAGEYPESRWVVKRSYDDQLHTWIYTDSRTPKVSQLKTNPNASLLYYHPKKKLQIRIQATTTIHTEGQAYEEHKSRILQRPADYTTLLTPGHLLEADQVQYGPEIHFALLQMVPVRWDILLLDREQHSRVIVEHKNSEWYSRSVTP